MSADRTGKTDIEIHALMYIAERIHDAMGTIGMPPAARMSVAATVLIAALTEQAQYDFDNAILNMKTTAEKLNTLAQAKSFEDLKPLLALIADGPITERKSS